MLANPDVRQALSEGAARRAPFERLIEIENPEKLRPGIIVPEDEQLGRLIIFPSCDAAIERVLPYAYYQMLQRAAKLVIRPVRVERLGRIRTVYVVVAEDEADEKVAMFDQWANHDDLGCAREPSLIRRYTFWGDFFGKAKYTIGWWAIACHMAWALTEEEAQRIICEGFQPAPG